MPMSTNPIERMERAFIGGYSRDQIEPRISEAMLLYGFELTAENYAQAGKALVDLRKFSGNPEMDILKRMIELYDSLSYMNFPDAAGSASAELVLGPVPGRR